MILYHVLSNYQPLKIFDIPPTAVHMHNQLFAPGDDALETWNRQGPLRIEKLLKKGLLKSLKDKFIKEYKLFRMCNINDAIFIGEADESGRPDGLVRVLCDGTIFEGQMSPDGFPNGWCRKILWSGESYLGWQANGK